MSDFGFALFLLALFVIYVKHRQIAEAVRMERGRCRQAVIDEGRLWPYPEWAFYNILMRIEGWDAEILRWKAPDEALPDCMMSDGTEPCHGFKYEQHRRRQAEEAVMAERARCYAWVMRVSRSEAARAILDGYDSSDRL